MKDAPESWKDFRGHYKILLMHRLYFILEHLIYGIQIVRWRDAEGEFESAVEGCCIPETTLADNVFH